MKKGNVYPVQEAHAITKWPLFFLFGKNIVVGKEG